MSLSPKLLVFQNLTISGRAGLDTKGSQSDGCEKSEGQVYGRAVEHEGLLALMYAWYMPKDEASPGMGHRHDFEHVIVWLSNVTESSEIVGVVISAHGGYQTSTGADLQVLEGRPTIGYVSYWPFNHQLIPTFAVGEEQPLIAWESMTDEARATINYHDFGSALPAFKESRFKGYVKRAYSLIFDSQAVLEAQETTESAAGSTTSPVPSEPSSSQTSTRTKHRRKR